MFYSQFDLIIDHFFSTQTNQQWIFFEENVHKRDIGINDNNKMKDYKKNINKQSLLVNKYNHFIVFIVLHEKNQSIINDDIILKNLLIFFFGQ